MFPLQVPGNSCPYLKYGAGFPKFHKHIVGNTLSLLGGPVLSSFHSFIHLFIYVFIYQTFLRDREDTAGRMEFA